MNKGKREQELRVFISYSHDSPEHADKVLDLSDRLIADGVDCILDQYEESPAEGWPRWMDTNIKNADFVLMICTETYYKRVMGEEEPGTGRGVRWEGNLIYNHIYNADTKTTKFIPVLFDSGKLEHIPTPLQGASRYNVDSERGYEDLYRRLTNQPRAKKPKLGKLKKLAGRARKQDFFAPQVTLAKLPSTSSLLLGRERELQWLDEAWESDTTHIFSLVAWGGVGKTALVNYWLTHKMGPDGYRGAGRVYGWSFYSQGTRETGQASSDIFLVEALKWFGDAETAESKKGPWQKGLRLAELVQQHKTLLILDGVEPLQYPPGPMQGRLKDQGLQVILKQLGASSNGLCLVTTRQEIVDIEQYEGSGLHRVSLEDLPEQAGIDLLKSYKIKGTKAELRKAVNEYGRHALALNLLGTYLSKLHHGEIRERDKIPQLIDIRQRQGKHAHKVMAAYENHLKGTPELDLLYILGLFDRPAEAGAIAALREKPATPEPAIEELGQDAACHSERSEESPPRPGQTLSRRAGTQGDSVEILSKLRDLSDSDYALSLANLRELRLIAEEDKGRPGTLDCHPLVREHFGQRLQKGSPAAWRQAQRRLYEYYKAVPEKEHPDTLEEMQPLFAAVAHGCQAGLHQEALDDVYWDRIKRKDAHYSTRRLGAFGSDLSALAGFFDGLWTKPGSG
ncbi:MAG: SEFIR domain-containing protein, partial [Planctomycetota bacterium]